MAFTDHIIIATPQSDTATIAASSEAVDLPATNLFRQAPTDGWLATSTANLALTINLAEASPGVALQPWDAILPLYTNFGAGDDFQIFAATTEAGLVNSPSFQTGLIPGLLSTDLEDLSFEFSHSLAWRESAEWPDTSIWPDLEVLAPVNRQPDGTQTESWIRIQLRVLNPKIGLLPVGTTDFALWGRLYICKVFQPPSHIAKGGGVKREERPRRASTFANSMRIGPRRAPRNGSYDLHFMNQETAEGASDDLDRLRAQSGDVVTIVNPTQLPKMHQEFIYGVMDSSARVHEHFDVYSKKLQIRELF